MVKHLLLVGTVLVFIATVAPIRSSSALQDQPDTLVIAHQGGDGIRPGNTMPAFEYAVELGVDMLEMDIHSTQDGVLVVIHDDTVDRTTDGTGRVQDFTFEELQKLDAAYSWTLADEEDVFPYRDQGITIPALEEIFVAFPDMPMNIEIKQKEPSITEPFCEMLREYELTEQVVVASFHPESMAEFRDVCPEVPTSGVELEIRRFYAYNLAGRSDSFEPEMAAFQVPEYFGDIQVITPEFVTNAQALGMEIHVWTVNEVEQMTRMIDVGVDGIITDYPDVLLDLLGRNIEDE